MNPPALAPLVNPTSLAVANTTVDPNRDPKEST